MKGYRPDPQPRTKCEAGNRKRQKRQFRVQLGGVTIQEEKRELKRLILA